MLAPRVELLIAARVLQALGGAACAVVSRAVVRDLYRGAEAARLNSRLVLVMGLAPILAPLVGGALLAAAGWRSIFGLLAAMAALAVVVTTFALPETAPPVTPATSGATLRALLGDRGFVRHAIMAATAQAGMFAYITGAPAVYITIHHVAPGQFGWFFGANAAGLIACSQLNARLLSEYSPAQLLRRGLIAASLAALAQVVVAVTAAGLWPTAAAYFAFVASLGLVSPNATTLALEDHGVRAGSAAAWLGALQFTTAAAASAAVSALADGTARPIAGVIATLALTATAINLARQR
jgi:DHA1 family bicyclomycin/chloramphenicol resistance-like MFS transporter